MLKTFRNAHPFPVIIGTLVLRPGDTVELVGYLGSMLTPVEADVAEPAAEPQAEEKPKRARKAAEQPVAEPEAE